MSLKSGKKVSKSPETELAIDSSAIDVQSLMRIMIMKSDMGIVGVCFVWSSRSGKYVSVLTNEPAVSCVTNNEA